MYTELKTSHNIALRQSDPSDREMFGLEILNTDTWLGFHVLWGHFIDTMIFILYKLYIFLPCPSQKM